MPLLDSLISPISRIIDKVIPDPEARDRAKLELLRQESSREVDMLQARLSAIIAEAGSVDPWTSRARPSFLYVMYAMILCALPMGLIGAFSPATADAVARGMTMYLRGIPEPLYALFGTGYLGYSAMRQWGKARGTDR